jgi:prephenate dehydrogenase
MESKVMKTHIIGLGNLGLFLARHFVESGFTVSGWDVDLKKEGMLSDLGGHWGQDNETDVVIFALFPAQIQPMLLSAQDPNALLVNLSSVQVSGIGALRNAGADPARIFSFHPLFGPVGVTKSGWAGKQIIVTAQQENDDRASALLETFTRKRVIVDQMSPEEHDQKMLPHALAFFIAELIKVGAEGADPRFLTGSGRQMLGLLDFTEANSDELRKLILSNPALKKVFPKLKEIFERLTSG